jgi:hypothetical protein
VLVGVEAAPLEGPHRYAPGLATRGISSITAAFMRSSSACIRTSATPIQAWHEAIAAALLLALTGVGAHTHHARRVSERGIEGVNVRARACVCVQWGVGGSETACSAASPLMRLRSASICDEPGSGGALTLIDSSAISCRRGSGA